MRPTPRRLTVAFGFFLLSGGSAQAGILATPDNDIWAPVKPVNSRLQPHREPNSVARPKAPPAPPKPARATLPERSRALTAASAIAPKFAPGTQGLDPRPRPAELGKSSELASPDFRKTFLKLPHDVRMAVVQKFGVKRVALALRSDYLKTLDKDYKVVIPRDRTTSKHIRDQGATGRCWIFATTSAMESGLFKQGIKRVDLSESFANFYAWKTRADRLLSLAERSKRPLRIDESIGFEEGGWFTWAGQLIEQHGMVPQRRMPDTADGADTEIVISKMKELIASAQAKFQRVRGNSAAAQAQRETIRDQYAKDINTLLVTTLGKPPGPDETFTFRGKRYTPKSYASEVLKFKASDYIVLSNVPSGKGWNKGYRESGALGLKGFPIYNVSVANLEKAVRATIDRGEAVWFSTTVGAENPYITWSGPDIPPVARNIMNLRAFDYGSLIPNPNLSKTARMTADVEPSNHAMTFVGYDYDKAEPDQVTKFKVDNSWGLRPGSKGHLDMYADFFKQYVDTVVVPRDVLPAELLRTLESRRIAAPRSRETHAAPAAQDRAMMGSS